MVHTPEGREVTEVNALINRGCQDAADKRYIRRIGAPLAYLFRCDELVKYPALHQNININERRGRDSWKNAPDFSFAFFFAFYLPNMYIFSHKINSVTG